MCQWLCKHCVLLHLWENDLLLLLCAHLLVNLSGIACFGVSQVLCRSHGMCTEVFFSVDLSTERSGNNYRRCLLIRLHIKYINSSGFWYCMYYLISGIIAKEPTSLEEELKEIRRNGSSRELDGSTSTTTGPSPSSSEFEMSDTFYFCRRGIECIVDDEVTKRFTAEELESWNLLTRSNYNFQHISTRLTVLWGLGVVIRYGFLLPLRWGRRKMGFYIKWRWYKRVVDVSMCPMVWQQKCKKQTKKNSNIEGKPLSCYLQV